MKKSSKKSRVKNLALWLGALFFLVCGSLGSKPKAGAQADPYYQPYKLVCDDDFGRFEKLVNEFTLEGWKPQGGVCLTKLSGGLSKIYVMYCQALVRW